MAEVVCLGEALIDFVAQESGISVGDSLGFVRAPGGAPANVAVGVARLGHSSAFLGKVGADPFGHFLGRTLAEAGVDTGGMVFDPRHRTGLAFVSLKASGERDFCFFRNPSADMTYTPGELDRNRIASGRIFHFGSISLIDPLARSATLAAAEIARSAGLLISYDPNLRPALWKSLAIARRTILRALPIANTVKLSGEELAFLVTGKYTPDTALSPEAAAIYGRRLHKRFHSLSLLTITLGAAGSLTIRPQGREQFQPGFAVDAVDTTGAGDGFVAGLLCGLLDAELLSAVHLDTAEEATLQTILYRANAVGALTTTRKGAIPALPTSVALSTFLRQSLINN